MKRKHVCYFCGLIVLLIVTVVGIGTAVLKYEPLFYRRNIVADTPDRKKLSNEFAGHFTQMLLDVRDERHDWHQTFSTEQINSFLDEEFTRHAEVESLRKLGISNPRVEIDEDLIRVGFRYGEGFFSTVVSYEMKVWLVPSDVNTIAVEMVQRRVGGFPITTSALMQHFIEQARRQNIEMSLFRHQGHPVAVLRFQSDRQRASTQIRHLSLKAGQITVAGASSESRSHQKGAQLKQSDPSILQ